MTTNSYVQPTKCNAIMKAALVDEGNTYTALTVTIDALTKQLETMSTNAIYSLVACELCGGPHASVDCQEGKLFSPSLVEQPQFVGNFNKQKNSLTSKIQSWMAKSSQIFMEK